MSTTVSYKGSTIATLSNETKTLTTAGTWVEGDISITDNGGTAAISVVDTTDSHGGTIREITAIDISDTTATAGDVASGKYFYTASGVKTAGTGSGGGSVTITDETNSTGITCVIVTSQTPTPTPVETWETIYNESNQSINSNQDGVTGYCWLSSLADVDIIDGSRWRITIDGVTYIETASYSSQDGRVNIPWGEGDNATIIFHTSSGAWIAYVTDRNSGMLSIKIEQEVI